MTEQEQWAAAYGTITGLGAYRPEVIAKFYTITCSDWFGGDGFNAVVELAKSMGLPAPVILPPESDRVDEWCDLYTVFVGFTLDHLGDPAPSTTYFEIVGGYRP